jgi:hypothetical protein
MDEAEWFVFLASPEAAASPWVNREIAHWLENRDIAHFLPVLTDGDWAWDDETNDFDFTVSTSVPSALQRAFLEEPRLVDLRWARTETDLNLRHSRFRDQIAEIAAPIHGTTKDELESEDIHEHRRTLRWAWGAVIALVCLTIVSIAASVVAVGQRTRADQAAAESKHRADLAEAQALAAQSHGVAGQDSTLALLLAVASQERADLRRVGPR